MLDNIMSLMAPHYCCGCDKIGSLLCANCKNNITDEPKLFCVSCMKPTGSEYLCHSCRVPYERAWLVGERCGVLQRLIGAYKFERAKSAHLLLGDLLLSVLPNLPSNTIIVPIPTVPSHVRERGYDHVLLIARYVAKSRGLRVERLLFRQTSTKQRQAGAKQRDDQAKRAFGVIDNIAPETPYLLIDDVVTTGATIKHASLALAKAGAKHVWVAAIARQTLD
jgi:ComF family protein